MTPDLLQTQFLKRYITLEPKAAPIAGPFASVGISTAWFTGYDNPGQIMTITKAGISAFWRGVRKHGHKAVMGRPSTPHGPDNTPTGGTPVAVAS